MTVFEKIGKSGFNRKHRKKALTFGYAAAIGGAFFLAIANNSDVSASVSHKATFDTLLLEDGINSNAQGGLYEDGIGTDIKSMFETVYLKEKSQPVEVTVQNGDNIIKILTALGMEYNEANKIVLELKKVFDIRALRVGQKILFTTVIDPKDNSFLYMKDLLIPAKMDERFFVERGENNEYSARAEKDELIEEINNATGSIEGTLSGSMNIQGVPNSIVNEFINIFSFSIDFRRDVHKGDKFEIIYENYINQDGELVRTGHILYAALQLKKERVALYRFTDSKGNVDYFDAKGFAMKKTLHRKPLAFQSARVTSPFGLRRHPIFKDKRIHWGIDYAAPRGTVIFAAGDGVVQMAQWHGGYGKFIKIRHNAEYSTAYGHMIGFAKGIKSGTRVKQGQTIGYVGSTGNSTGNHLHYEVIKDGRRVNPNIVKASASENLKGVDFDNFKKTMASIKENHKAMFAEFEKNLVAVK